MLTVGDSTAADAVSAPPAVAPVPRSAQDVRPLVAFVVNGDEQSAMAERAQSFTRQLEADWRIHLFYRSGGRFHSIRPLIRSLLGVKPRATWVFDMALAGVAAAAAARVSGTRMVVDTGDAITALARHSGTRSVAGIGATAALEWFAPAVADAIVVRGTEHQRLLRQRGYDATVIPDGVDLAVFQRGESRAQSRQMLQLSGELVVGLVGSMVWNPKLRLTYGWDLVEALALTRDLPVVGVLVGDGSGVVHLKKRAAALGIEHRIRFLGRAPFEALPGLLAACDVCLSTQTNDVVGRVRTTGKLPLYMASGRYVLASRVGEAARVLPDEMLIDYHGTVDRLYPERLAARLRQLCGDRGRLRLGQSLVDVARREFAYNALARRVDGVLRSVLATASTRDVSA